MTHTRPVVLVLEDDPDDAELIGREIRHLGVDPLLLFASDERGFEAGLDGPDGPPSIVITDYNVPGFSGVSALLSLHRRAPGTPCIMVSGVLGEELAVTAMRAGATDYVVKQRLDLLGPAVTRALHEADEAAEVHRLEVALAAAEASAATMAATEDEVRHALGEVLAHVPAGAPAEAVAGAVCEEAVRLPGITAAAVVVHSDGGARLIAAIGCDQPGSDAARAIPAGGAIPPCAAVPAGAAALVRTRSAHEPWLTRADGEDATALLDGLGVEAAAVGPIVHGPHRDGALILGSHDPEAVSAGLGASAVATFSSVASALLGDRLHEVRRVDERRRVVLGVLERGAFKVVFQPVVDLETSEIVAFEALSRFAASVRPDVFFGDAWSVGLGIKAELATLEVAVEDARRLPPGRWLHLNISPRLLLEEQEHLSELMSGTGRPVVVEITEHEPIDDYAAVREAVHALGSDLRLAVDDAGAGVANFGHIIALRPNFVKLDMHLVRGVNADLGRQALVVGMRHFSRTAGCQLVAEGIETAAEASILRSLGVGFGQGYLFGRPDGVAAWTRASRSVAF